MSKPPLALVSPPATTPQERVARLQAEARQAVAEHLAQMAEAAQEAARLAQEVADGGDLYHPGLRAAAQQLAADINGRLQTIAAIAQRTGMGR